MSEGRTPDATFTELRKLEPEDVDILHQIVIRAQNDPISDTNQKDALLKAYGEIFDERHLNAHQDRACFNVLLKLLNPAAEGPSLYHRFEAILEQEGIKLAYDDDATTSQTTRQSVDHGVVIGQPRHGQAPDVFARQTRLAAIEVPPNGDVFDGEDDFDNQSPRIIDMMRQAEARDRAVLAKQTFEALRSAKLSRTEQQLLKVADSLYEQKLKRKVLKQVLAIYEEHERLEKQADQFYDRRLATSVLRKGLDEYRLRRVASIDHDRIAGFCLYKLTLAARESALQRKREARSKTLVLHKLHGRLLGERARRAELEGILHQYEDQQRQAVLQGALSSFAKRSNTIHGTQIKADSRYQRSLIYASIDVWRERLGKQRDTNITAEDAREYFLMKRFFQCLRVKRETQKIRRTVLAKWTANRWKIFVNANKHARYDEVYKRMRRTIKVNLARKTLRLLHQHTVFTREAQLHADVTYHNALLTRLAHPLVIYLSDACSRNTQNETLAARQSDQRLKRLTWQAIGFNANRVKSICSDADRFRQIKVEQRAQGYLRELRMEAWRVRRDKSDADAVWAHRGRRSVRNTLAKMRIQALAGQHGVKNTLSLPAQDSADSLRAETSATSTNMAATTANALLPVMTPARKRDQLMVESSTRFSTTPAYTPFMSRLRAGPRVITEDDSTMDGEGDDVMDESVLDISA